MTCHFEKFTITTTPTGFNIVFRNMATQGADIQVSIPKQGVFETEPSREITKSEVRNLAKTLSKVLDISLI